MAFEGKSFMQRSLGETVKSLGIALWFMFLTFPIMVIKVNALEKTIEWRWMRMVYVGVGAFFLSFVWRYLLERKERGSEKEEGDSWQKRLGDRFRSDKRISVPAIAALAVIIVAFPFFGQIQNVLAAKFGLQFFVKFSDYQTSIMIQTLTYVMLGLGLNIVVGLAGLLDLGYVAFYAVGAYFYALMNHHFGLGFWAALPLAGAMAATFGIILGFPVLRLRGDYLAIVTLGFGEIIRLILQNWNDFSFGPSGIANIARPGAFGYTMTIQGHTIYLYYIMLVLVLFTIIMVNRLRDSRIGRAWIALREDEIACQAMGIDKTRVKLLAFAMGATWAGLAGCIFAAKTTFINPDSFTFMESAMILSIVVLGGMGSVLGVMVGACFIILIPEFLRSFSEYRMLAFGVSMVLIMVFRPQGIIGSIRRSYVFQKEPGAELQGEKEEKDAASA
jgi:branched-chain amino acid transport system permease protein